MTVFEAFPQAIRYWDLCKIEHDTGIGDYLSDVETSVRVIIDEICNVAQASATQPAVAESKALVYAHPADLPSVKLGEYLQGYVWRDEDGMLYSIDEAANGYDQESATLEHIEFTLTPTELA